jgi:peptide/nickel transport system substrate-binding protein
MNPISNLSRRRGARRGTAFGAFVAASLIAVAFMTSAAVQAKTYRFADQGDAISMDPHSLNESLQLSFTGNMYEGLTGRGKNLELVPALATKWTNTSPTVWRFELRKGVQFHDGSPFTADDVLFSLGRTQRGSSDMKSYTNDVTAVKKIDSHTVEITTKAPFPILPDVIAGVYIMSKKWCEENKAEDPVDKRKGIENTASFKTNGTGPFA